MEFFDTKISALTVSVADLVVNRHGIGIPGNIKGAHLYSIKVFTQGAQELRKLTRSAYLRGRMTAPFFSSLDVKP